MALSNRYVKKNSMALICKGNANGSREGPLTCSRQQVGEGVERRGGAQLGVQTGGPRKTVWPILRELRVEMPCEAVIPLLGIYPKNLQT